MHAVVVGDGAAAEECGATADAEVAEDGVAPEDGLAARDCVGACNDAAVDGGTPDGGAVLDITELVMVGVEKGFRKFDRDAWSSAVSEP